MILRAQSSRAIPTPIGISRVGAMTPCRRTMDHGRHARVWPRSFRAGAVLVHVAGRVDAPEAGRMVGAHLDLRRPPGDRRRADADAMSIAGPVPVAAPVLAQFLEDQLPDGCLRPADLTPMVSRTPGSWQARRARIWKRR